MDGSRRTVGISSSYSDESDSSASYWSLAVLSTNFLSRKPRITETITSFVSEFGAGADGPADAGTASYGGWCVWSSVLNLLEVLSPEFCEAPADLSDGKDPPTPGPDEDLGAWRLSSVAGARRFSYDFFHSTKAQMKMINNASYTHRGVRSRIASRVARALRCDHREAFIKESLALRHANRIASSPNLIVRRASRTVA